jgi:hypothetical protein
MFGTQSRRKQAVKTAEDAWDYLVSAVDSAGDAAKSAGKRTAHIADDTSSRVSSAADEAWHRASRALDALGGKRTSPSWLWLIGAVAAGAAIGWAAATAGPRAIAAVEDKLNHEEEALDLPAPTAIR